MNWDAIGAVGEILGAVAVVATLGYLAVQIKQNARSVVASTSQAITRSQNELNVAVMTDPELADIVFSQGIRDYNSLDSIGKIRFNNYMTAALNVYQDTYVQHTQGVSVESQWDVSRAIMGQILSSKNMQKWWTDPRLNMQSRLQPAFSAEIDSIIEEIRQGIPSEA